jgi:hypothetical protein
MFFHQRFQGLVLVPVELFHLILLFWPIPLTRLTHDHLHLVPRLALDEIADEHGPLVAQRTLVLVLGILAVEGV